jgi:hypothetical protein
MREYDEEKDPPERDYLAAASFPAVVRAAGIIWIVIGCILVLNAGLIVVQAGTAAAGAPRDAGPTAAGGACSAILVGLFAAAFIFVGVQSINGTARDTLGNAIGSLVFGVLNMGWGVVVAGFGAMLSGRQGDMSVVAVLLGGIGMVAGGALTVAGILALVGRGQYRAWRQAQKARRLRDER